MSDKTFSERWIPDEMKTKWFLFLLISLVLFGATWWTNLHWGIKAFFLGVLVLCHSLFTIKITLKLKDSAFPKLTDILWMIMMWLLLAAYVAVSIRAVEMTIYLILLLPIIATLSVLIPYLRTFWKSDKLPIRLFSYIMISLLVIFLWAYLYTAITGFPGNTLIAQNANTKTDSWDNTYYSATVFYSVALGDYFPAGIGMRTLTILEALLSIILHVFLVAEIYSRISSAKDCNKTLYRKFSLQDIKTAEPASPGKLGALEKGWIVGDLLPVDLFSELHSKTTKVKISVHTKSAFRESEPSGEFRSSNFATIVMPISGRIIHFFKNAEDKIRKFETCEGEIIYYRANVKHRWEIPKDQETAKIMTVEFENA